MTHLPMPGNGDWRANVRAIVLAGVAAGVVSTLAQVVLWQLLTDELPGVLYRDARLAAAIVLGPSALEPAETATVQIMLIASFVHFALSIAFAAALAVLIAPRSMAASLAIGAAFGAVLYLVNLHAMTWVFPWFDVARGAITLAAHVVFGVAAAAAYRYARRCNAPPGIRRDVN